MAKYLGLFTLCLVMLGCTATGTTPADKRASIEKMHDRVLAEVYAKSPEARKLVARSAGYAVFSNAKVQMFFVAAGTGYGVAKSGGRSTYMNMGEAGLGLGMGVKDFRVLFIFHTDKAYKQFVEQGWAVGAEVDAAAKSANKGAEVGGGITFGNVTVYQTTESGIALQATVKGTRYWKDPELN